MSATCRYLSVCLLLAACARAPAPQPAPVPPLPPPGSLWHALALGDASVGLAVGAAQCEGGVLLIGLHDSEQTARLAAQQAWPARDARLVWLLNGQRRALAFTVNGDTYRADPNRIFTPAGVAATLAYYGKDAWPARQALARFAGQLLATAGVARASAVVALHNNHAGGYSAASYLAGGKLAAAARAVHLGEPAAPDNFFYLTDARLFAALSAQGFNVVLQDNARVPDDGSLSVLAARLGLVYVNVEARQGEVDAQRRMLIALRPLLRGAHCPGAGERAPAGG
ncbi:hypothetical protein [Crenobacter caeni]|uniref:Uncharacterized protein n=1 Tax=Crenobacter caeni TaxID=2705474 RepID=A0A6B2KRI6_9NEIS|nr:hypothetical protein [Crenobacter caeni]NDV12671.1 hypothetical protein [Crenobacter caeni]